MTVILGSDAAGETLKTLLKITCLKMLMTSKTLQMSKKILLIIRLRLQQVSMN